MEKTKQSKWSKHLIVLPEIHKKFKNLQHEMGKLLGDEIYQNELIIMMIELMIEKYKISPENIHSPKRRV